MRAKLISGAWHGLLGFVVPTVILIVAYPVLLSELGATGFGLFILVSAAIGAIGVFDLGVSAGVVKFLSEDLAGNQPQSASHVFATGLVFYVSLGIGLSALLWHAAYFLPQMMDVPAGMHDAATDAIKLGAVQLALALPLTLFISTLKGMQRYDYSTATIALQTAVSYGGAAWSVKFAGGGLSEVVAWGCAANGIALAVAAYLTMRASTAYDLDFARGRAKLAVLSRMLSYSIALLVHALASNFFTHGQRLVVGATLGPHAVSTYTLGQTLVSKVHAAVNAATEIMFPISSGAKDIKALRAMYVRVTAVSIAFSAIALLSLTLLAKPILTAWLGPTMAEEITPFIGIFSAGFFILSFSPPAYHLVNGRGMPWLNVCFDLLNVAIASALIAIAIFSGTTLLKMVWVFAISNIVQSVIYQYVVERYCWRRWLAATPPACCA